MVKEPVITGVVGEHAAVARGEPGRAALEYRPAELLERPARVVRARHHERIARIPRAAAVARVEQVIDPVAESDPDAFDQRAVGLRGVRKDELDGRATRKKAHAVARELLHLDRLAARAPIEQPLSGSRIVERHGIDVLDAFAAKKRLAGVRERAGGVARGGDGEALALASIGLRRVVHHIGIELAIVDHMRRPKVLRGGRPSGLAGQRVAKQRPLNEIRRAGHLDVQHLSVRFALRGIRIKPAVRGAQHRGIGEVPVDHGVHVCPLRQRRAGGYSQRQERHKPPEQRHYSLI